MGPVETTALPIFSRPVPTLTWCRRRRPQAQIMDRCHLFCSDATALAWYVVCAAAAGVFRLARVVCRNTLANPLYSTGQKQSWQICIARPRMGVRRHHRRHLCMRANARGAT